MLDRFAWLLLAALLPIPLLAVPPDAPAAPGGTGRVPLSRTKTDAYDPLALPVPRQALPRAVVFLMGPLRSIVPATGDLPESIKRKYIIV